MNQNPINRCGHQSPGLLLHSASTWHGLAVTAVVVLGVLLYGHTLQAPFYLDDVANVRDNLPVLKGFSLSELTETAFGGLLKRRPLANLSFALNGYVHGLDSLGYHMVNIAIHIFNGIFLYWFLFKTLTLVKQDRKRSRSAMLALAATLLWVAHPLQIQSVTYVVQRMTSMAALFTWMTFLAFIYGRLTRSKKAKFFLFLLAAFFWVAAVASKEIAITVPLLVFTYEWFFFQKLKKSWILRWSIPGLAIIGALLLGVNWLYGYTPVTFFTVIDQPRGFTAYERLLTESRVVFLYISLLIFPHPTRLNLNHDIPVSLSLTEPVTTLLSCLSLLAIVIFMVLYAKRYRLVIFCFVWFFVSLSVEGLAASIELMFEHRVYLPSALIFVPCILVADRVKKPVVFTTAFVATLLVVSIWTYERNALWNHPVAFWEDAAKKSPNHFRPHFQLGTSYLNDGEIDKAVHAFQRSLTLNPPYPTEIFTNMGISYYKKGDTDRAREHLEKALDLNPNNYIALDALGTLDLNDKKFTEAIENYKKAIELRPNFIQASKNLGLLYLNMGKLDEAHKLFEQLIQNHPASSAGYSGLGLTYARQEKVDMAIPLFEVAVGRNPRDRDAVFNLAISYVFMKQYAKATEAYEKILQLDPSDVETMHNLGVLYLQHLHDAKRAMEYFEKALATDPNYSHATFARQILARGT